jgi:hypothetical protein
MINTTVATGVPYTHISTGTCDTSSQYVNNDSALLELLRSMVGVKDNDSLTKWVKTASTPTPARPLPDWVNLGYNKFYKGED